MYPILPLGPLSFPTGPILTLVAIIVGLDIGGRYGRKLGISSDDVWNTGLIGFASGLIVARLWNVFQFWSIYSGEPILIVSLRPSGFTLWPGVIAALIGAYAYLIYRSLDPVRMAAALAMGGLAGGVILSFSGYLTGSVLGAPSDVAWAVEYYGVPRHPVAIYQAFSLAALAALLWIRMDPQRPGRTVLWALFGYSLIRLFLDGFREGMEMFGSVRLSQVVAFAFALVCVVLLARGDKDAGTEAESATVAQ